MVSVTHQTTASRLRVWELLSDGWCYASWVVGASRIRAVDAHWPAPGSAIHHSIGIWPLLLNETTEVIGMDAGRMLVLDAHAWPVGHTWIVLRISEDGSGTRIEMNERVDSAPLAAIPAAAQNLLLHPRSRESLCRLAFLAERTAEVQT